MGREARAIGLAGATMLLVVAVFGGAMACAPSPKSLPCANDGECSAASDAYAFCVDARCVECVGRGSCGGNPCVEGTCSIPCKETGHCPDDRVCAEGACVRR